MLLLTCTLLLTSLCFPTAASVAIGRGMVTRDFPPGLSIPSDITRWAPYEYSGCFTDNGGSRALTVLSGTASTIEECLSFCNLRAGFLTFTYVGLEFGHECYCDWVLQNNAVQVDDSECNIPCVGNSSQPCGGAARLTVLSSGSSPTVAPATILTGNNDWTYQGCYHDSQTAKVFPLRAVLSDLDTRFFSLELCADACGKLGFSYAGIEFRNECWCGTAEQLATSQTGPDSDCGMACGTNPFRRCGGPDRMSVYKLS